MAADEDRKEPGDSGEAGNGDAKAGERRQRERKRAPVTIDLKADEVRATPADPPAAKAPQAQPEPPAKPSPPSVPQAQSQTPTQTPPESAAKPAAAEPPRAAQPERPAASPPPPPPSPPPQPASPGGRPRAAFTSMDDLTRRTVIAGVAGGAIALVLAIILQAVGVLPAPGRAAADAAAEQARAAAESTSSLDRRLTAAEAMVQGLSALRASIANADTGVAAVRAALASLATRADLEGAVALVGQLRQRIDALPASVTRADLDALTDRLARLEVALAAGGGGSAASDAAVAALSAKLGEAETALRSLTDRLAAAESEVAGLDTRPMAGGEAAVRAIAITALRRASERGEPFTGEVDMVAALGVPAEDVSALRPFADRGVPATSALVAVFPVVADAILTASATSDPDAGFIDRIVSGLGGLVSIRPAGPIAGTDAPAIVSRMVAAVDAGDLAAALAERAGLPEPGKTASAEWASRAGDRVALDALVERIARALGDIGSG